MFATKQCRRIIVLAALAVQICGFTSSVWADQSGDFTFQSDGVSVAITGYTGPGGSVVIPEAVNGVPVTRIGDNAFIGCFSLTGVSFPASLTHIGYQAFNGCIGLKDLTIPGTVISVDGYAFSYCSGLTNVTVGEGVTSIGGGAFSVCTSLSSVVFPDSLQTISGYMFINSWGLGKVFLGKNVTTVGDVAFYGCSGLTGVYFNGNAPTSVGVNLFYQDTSATVYYKSGTTGWGATFAGRPTALWPGTQSPDSDFTYKIIGSTVTITGYTGARSNLIIPSVINDLPVTGIARFAFTYCSNLTSVTIPASVSQVESLGIYNQTLTSVGVDPANTNYTSLNGVLVDKRQSSLVQYPTGRPDKSYTIPSGIASIGQEAFLGCPNLTSVTFPSSVTNIGYEGFHGCVGLKNVVIPATVVDIGGYAFDYCSGLTNFTIANGVKSIGGGIFAVCTSLSNVTLPESITIVPGYAFINCSGLKQVSLGSNVTSVGDASFYKCASLSGVFFGGNAPSSVGANVFYGDNSTTVFYQAGTTGWGTMFAGRPTAPMGVTPPPPASSNFTYRVVGSTVTLGRYIGTGGVVSIPATIESRAVTSIGYECFQNITNVTGIQIPFSINNIDSYAFAWCTGLKTITLPEALTNIGSYAFKGCSRLTNVTFRFQLTSIGAFAFEGTGLTSITIPARVSAWDNAFGGCTNLVNVNILNGVPRVGNGTFDGCTRLANVSLPPSIASIGNRAFASCTGLASLTIPAAVRAIGTEAFVLCSGLRSIYFYGNPPGTVRTNAFSGVSATIYYTKDAIGWTSQFEGLPTALWPGVVARMQNDHMVLTWPQGVLLESTNPTSGWTTNAAARSPYTVTPGGPLKFYRVKFN